MMRPDKNRIGFAWINAAVIWGAVWLLAASAGVSWVNADDPLIAYLLKQTASGGSPFQQKLLSLAAHVLFSRISDVNFWLLFYLLCVSTGAACSGFIIGKNAKGIISIVYSAFSVLCVYFFAVRKASFTCSAAIISAAGSMMVIDAIYSDRNPGEYFTGILFLLSGFAIRENAGYINLGFLAAMGLVCMDFSGIHNVGELLHKNYRRMVLLLIPAVLSLGSIAVNRNLRTDEEKSYGSYNHICAEIRDYVPAYPSWEKAKEIYTGLGLSENDYDLLFNRWVFDDPEVFTKEKLQKIGGLKYSNRTASDLLKAPLGAVAGLAGELYFDILVAVGILISIRMWKNKKVRWKIICLWCFETVYFLYLVYRGRIVNHVIFSILWGLDCCLMLLLSREDSIRSGKNSRISPWLLLGFTVAVASGIRLSGHALYTPGNDLGTTENGNRAFYDELNAREDDIFILAPNLTKHYCLARGPWSSFPEGYCENVFYLGGWQARTGYCVSNLAERGIENPMRALLENDRVYSMMDENTFSIMNFLREHYDPTASYALVEQIGGNQLIRYCGRLDESVIIPAENVRENHTAECSMLTGSPVIVLEGELSGDTENLTDVYCSVSVGESSYSYALNYDCGKFSGYLFILDGSGALPDPDSIKITGKNTSGELLEIS